MRNTSYALISIVFSLLLFAMTAEIVLRFLPVGSGTRPLPVTPDSPLLRGTPNRTFTLSRGWNFPISNKVHVNNHGFVNDQDYRKNLDQPVVAVIGDSYVEALMTPYAETLHGRAAKDCKEAYFYSFGFSGAQLPQYLAYARYARKHFSPQKVIFVIVANDFDESFAKYHGSPGLYHFAETQGLRSQLELFEYCPHKWRDTLYRSALVRYGVFNLAARPSAIRTRLQRFFSSSQDYLGNVDAGVSTQRLADSKHAADLFLEALPAYSGVLASNTLFVLDGIRQAIYRPDKYPNVQGSYFAKMRRYFIDEAQKAGFQVVDLHQIFEGHFQKYKQHFEFQTDNHWSGIGHGVAYDAVKKRGFLDSWATK